MGCVVITPVGVAVWHEALPADGPSLGMPAVGVIGLDSGSTIFCKAGAQERAHVGRGEACCLLIADQDIIASLKVIADGGIATALKF